MLKLTLGIIGALFVSIGLGLAWLPLGLISLGVFVILAAMEANR